MLKRSISVLLVVVMMLAVLVVAAPIAQARNVGGTLTETSASRAM